MSLPASCPPVYSVTVVHDEAALVRLRTDWETLEDQAEEGGRYSSWAYVRLAWQHLAPPGARLWLMLVRDRQGRLHGALPLACVTERHHGMPLRVLRHVGIWEGDRPGLLALDDGDGVWAVLWEALVARRADWQVLDLRELLPGSWPLRRLARPKRGFSSQMRPDIVAPFQRLDGDWAAHAASRSAAVQAAHARCRDRLQSLHPGATTWVASTADDILPALDRYLQLERPWMATGHAITLGCNLRLVAFYRDWLPRLAARGDAAVWLLLDGEGKALAGLIRLRDGDTWIERHACFDPGHADLAPTLLLATEALQRSFGTSAQVSTLVNLIEPTDAGAAGVRHWYDEPCQTQRLSVRNLRSWLGLVMWLKEQVDRFRRA
jgi:hypothetical protein